MSDAAIAARLIEALNAAAGAGGALVSVEITMLAHGDGVRVETRVVRKTRTLVFMGAECLGDAGERIATATSVHKVTDSPFP